VIEICGDRYAEAGNLSEGWLGAVRCMDRIKGKKAVHLLVRIADPTREDPEIRAAAQGLIDERNRVARSAKDELYDIETTRNTIFPAAWARRNPKPSDLAAYYNERYESLRGFKHNDRGTYFGRVVAYPGPDGSIDQLTDTVRKLKAELDTSKSGRASNKSSRYEINIYNAACDRNPMSFPCLAHISVHLHDRRLHMQAVYRNEYLIGRAYGNYLGLAELQQYMAVAAGIKPGELLMTINHAELDSTKRDLKPLLDQFADR
jgi:thymidylate synthase